MPPTEVQDEVSLRAVPCSDPSVDPVADEEDIEVVFVRDWRDKEAGHNYIHAITL